MWLQALNLAEYIDQTVLCSDPRRKLLNDEEIEDRFAIHNYRVSPLKNKTSSKNKIYLQVSFWVKYMAFPENKNPLGSVSELKLIYPKLVARAALT